MNHRKVTAIALLGMLVLLLAACAGAAGEPGPAGPAGPAGPQGPAGPAATTVDLTCSECHNDTTLITGKEAAWSESLHGTGEAYVTRHERQLRRLPLRWRLQRHGRCGLEPGFG